VRIDGQVVNERRKEAVDRFQSDNGCRAALLSITAAGVGITLTAATVCVFVELYWNPSQLVQAEDRAHRLGQKRALEVHYLIAPGSGGAGGGAQWALGGLAGWRPATMSDAVCLRVWV
jgi:SWI/SNF-related matrix-associated actin-dependent regulator 1 of chromatin subfamily A